MGVRRAAKAPMAADSGYLESKLDTFLLLDRNELLQQHRDVQLKAATFPPVALLFQGMMVD